PGDLGARGMEIDEGVGQVELVKQVDRLGAMTRRNLPGPIRLAARGVGVLRVRGGTGEGRVDFWFRAVEEPVVEEHVGPSAAERPSSPAGGDKRAVEIVEP